MASSMDTSTGVGASPNPFANVTAAPSIPTSSAGFQHGSLERNTGAESSGTYQHLLTPTPPRSPSSRGVRSRRRERSSSRTESRDENRRSNRAEAPVGYGFRVQAVETSLQQHHGELQAQRLEIEQLKHMVQSLMTNKEETNTKLDKCFGRVDSFTEACFGKVDSKFTEAMNKIDEFYNSTQSKFQTLTDVMNGLAQSTQGRLDGLSTGLEQTRASMIAQDQPRGTSSVLQPPTAAPPSWSDSRVPHLSPSPAFGIQTGGDVFRADAASSHSGVHQSTFGPQSPVHPSAAPRRTQGYDTSFETFASPMAARNLMHNDGQRPAHFHVGSPEASIGSPLNPTRGVTSQWAAGAGTEMKAFDPKDWAVDQKKPSKELKSFDGDLAFYDSWRRRVRDHFVSVNCNYGLIFDTIESTKVPINWSTLAMTRNQQLPFMNWEWAATHIWTFIGGYLSDDIMRRRMTLTNGQDYNGLELWRALYAENNGGSTELAVLERGWFIDFPKCDKPHELQPHLSAWIQLKNKYGLGLPMEHLICQFWKILPDIVKDDVKKQKDCVGNLDKQIAYVLSTLTEHSDEKLSKWNLKKLQDTLKFKPKNSTSLHAIASASTEAEVPPPPPLTMEAMTQNIERIVAAALTRTNDRGRAPARSGSTSGSRSGSNGSQRGGQRQRMPNPKFKGCWDCGGDHNRRDCPKFKKVLADNGGKLPKGYEGNYEKAMKAGRGPPTKISAVGVVSHPRDNGLLEHAETTPLWPLMKMPPMTPVATSNKFSAFEDESDDDEDEVMQALNAITPNVQRASDKKLPQRVRRAKSKPMTLARINSIARKVKTGEIQLPTIDLEENEEYESRWCMVDSGAGANVAKKEDLPHSVKVKAPSISLTIANGTVMPNNGARSVDCYDKSGKKTTRVFYEAPVEMPILAVTEIAKEGDLGSEVRFRCQDGEIIDSLSGQSTEFVKRMGVYFMRIYFPKVKGRNNLDFGRQEP